MAIYIKDRTHILHIFCEGKVEEYDSPWNEEEVVHFDVTVVV